MTTTILNKKISEVGNKISDNARLTEESFTATLKQVDLVKKTGFDNKLASFNRRISSNKTKHLEVQKKLNNLITTDSNFFFGRIYFTSNDGFQNTFVYQPKLDGLELKKAKVLIMFLVENQRKYLILNLNHYILLSCLALNFLNIELEQNLIKIF